MITVFYLPCSRLLTLLPLLFTLHLPAWSAPAQPIHPEASPVIVTPPMIHSGVLPLHSPAPQSFNIDTARQYLAELAADTGGEIRIHAADSSVYASPKTGSLLTDAEMRQNARRNMELYQWARDYRDDLIRQLDPYLRISLTELRGLLPGQEMGRSRTLYTEHSMTSPHSKGCPRCFLDHDGEHVGPDLSRVDVTGRPWQAQCMRCETWFPMNDFASYYKSALDENGRFRPGEGDPEFLEPMDGVEGEARKWIEDGTGIEYAGLQWFVAGRYADEVWRELSSTARDLATLYTLTGDAEYARRSAVILDRMADLYPEMDERPHRESGMFTSYGPGRIMGRGWEYSAVRRPVSEAYDLIYDAIREDEELVRFLNSMSHLHQGPDKSSFPAIDHNIRENLLVEFVEDLIEHREDLMRGRAQSAYAVTAVVLDDPERTPDWLNWLFQEDGGSLPYTLVEHMQRDGFNMNSGMGYSGTSGRMMYRIAEVMSRFESNGTDLYSLYPNLLNSFTMFSKMRILDTTEPAVGDGGSSMQMAMTRYPMEMLLDGYRRFRSPDIAREIILNLPDGRESGVRPQEILSETTEAHEMLGLVEAESILEHLVYESDPAGFFDEIQSHLSERHPPHESYNSGGTGFAALQSPWRKNGRAGAIWYGRTMWPSHTHFDRLTLHLWAFDEVLMPDTGYPEFTGNWPKRHGFTRHTVSHNTLMMNDTRQGGSYSGKTRLFADSTPLRVADIDGLGSETAAPYWDQNLYDGARTYRRAAVMVDVDEKNSYLLDLFWARGGDNHRLIQNSGSSAAIPHGLDMIPQASGTFAGPDIEFGREYDGELTSGYSGSGFQFLKSVERDENPAESFRIDWPVEPRYEKPEGWNGHMRLHNLAQVDEVALASGEPSRGHPEQIRYSIRSRLGQDLSSQFISVIEPYMDEPFIREAEVLKRVENDDEPFAAAVKIRMHDGSHDVILARKEPGVLEVDGLRLDGRLGLARYGPDGELSTLIAVAARELSAGSHRIRQNPGMYEGELVSFDDSDPHNVLLHLSEPLTEDAAGQYIIFDNSEVADGSYRIESLAGERTVNIGRISLYERLADRDDYDAGRIPNLVPGERYIVPRSAVYTVD